MEALSNSVSGWHVASDTSIGTACGWIDDSRFPNLGPSARMSVDYQSRGLTGTIPTEFGVLTQVTYFQLASNSLTGSLPSQLGRLGKMASNFGELGWG